MIKATLFPRINCKGYYDGIGEFGCWYENAEDFECSDCICNGGRFSPISGNAWKKETVEKYCKIHGISTYKEREDI